MEEGEDSLKDLLQHRCDWIGLLWRCSYFVLGLSDIYGHPLSVEEAMDAWIENWGNVDIESDCVNE